MNLSAEDPKAGTDPSADLTSTEHLNSIHIFNLDEIFLTRKIRCEKKHELHPALKEPHTHTHLSLPCP